METIINAIQKFFILEKEPQKIGLTQFRDQEHPRKKVEKPSLKNKDVKLSDLMRKN